MTTIKKLELRGKRWLERTNGNTYFSAVALYNGAEIARIDFAYGYGDQWFSDLCRLIVVDGIAIGDRQNPYDFLRQLENSGIAVFHYVHNVSRKKDLQL
jgi:hypothetical protein